MRARIELILTVYLITKTTQTYITYKSLMWLRPDMSDWQIQCRINHITPYRSKALHRHEENARYLVDRFGVDRCAFLSLMFPPGTPYGETQRRFNSAGKVFRELFVHYIAFLGLSDAGAVHLHMIVVMNGDVRTGFDFEAAEAFNAIGRKAYLRGVPLTPQERGKRGALSRKLNRNALLAHCCKVLRERLPRYGFASQFGFHLTPIRKGSKAVAGYLKKNVKKLYREGNLPPRARTVRYSHKCPQAIQKLQFGWASKGSRDYRRRVKAVAEQKGCYTWEQARNFLGDNWTYRYREEIRRVKLPLLDISPE